MRSNNIRHPDMVSGEEFLYEHGYKLVLEGRYYDPDFAKAKLFLPSLAGISDLKVFINKVKTDEQFAQSAVTELIDLWQSDFDLRPATGMILLAALWDKLNQFRTRKDFVSFCTDLFYVLAGVKKKGKPIQEFPVTGHEDIIKDLLQETNCY